MGASAVTIARSGLRCDRLQEWLSQLTTHTFEGASAGTIARPV